MAITLTFTDETPGGDIDLQGSTEGVIAFNPKPPTAPDATFLTDTIVLYLDDGAQVARTGNGYIHRLERYFERARRRQLQQTGVRIWLKYKPYDADDLYRTEVLDGRVVWADGTAGAAWLPSDRGECAIIVMHKPYWEHDTEQELPLYNDNASGTGGADIVNHNDNESGDDNWVLIEGTDVEGSLPAPVRIEFEVTSALGTDEQVWLCHTIETDDGSGSDQIWTIEGEDNEDATPGTVTADTSSSGDAYIAESWSATTETVIAFWTLGGAYLAAAAGNPFRAVMRVITQVYSDLYVRLWIADTGGGELWSTPLILAQQNSELIDFGTIPSLPPLPANDGATDYSDHRLYFSATKGTVGTKGINIDCIHLFPIDGGFRKLEATANGASNTQFIVDDGIQGRTYRRTAGGEVWAMFVNFGDWIRVVPGRTQRLAFLWKTSAGKATPTRTATVRLYYRPRRASF